MLRLAAAEFPRPVLTAQHDQKVAESLCFLKLLKADSYPGWPDGFAFRLTDVGRCIGDALREGRPYRLPQPPKGWPFHTSGHDWGSES